MPEIRYRLTLRQRLVYLVFGLAVIAVGAPALAGEYAPLAIAGASLVFTTVLLAFTHRGITLDSAGIRVPGPRSRRVPWESITAVEVAPRLGGAGVRIRLDDGRARWLPVPLTGYADRDPRFEEKAAAIRRCWEERRLP